MATSLTEAEQLTICTILNVDFLSLQYHLSFYATRYTTASDAAVRTQLTRWGTSGTKFTKLYPKESNKGVRTDPEWIKDDIRKNVATLLYIPDDQLNSGDNYLERG